MKDRRARNQIANYVGGNAHHSSLPKDKTLVINSEFMVNEDTAIPQLYVQEKGKTKRIPMFDKANNHAEGEGASFSPIVCQHETENCFIVSNDTDAIIYALLAGIQRPRNERHQFKSELWVQIVYSQSNSEEVLGTKKGKTAEFWNINNLIYNIEAKFRAKGSIKNPVMEIVALYLVGGCDHTEKWHAKTHETFMSQWLYHSDYVKDLAQIGEDNRPQIDINAYIRLIHATWCGKSVKDPSSIPFEKLRSATEKRRDKRLQMPHEKVISQLKKRVCGTFLYMLSYITEENIPDWLDYGFLFDNIEKVFIPNTVPIELMKPQESNGKGNKVSQTREQDGLSRFMQLRDITNCKVEPKGRKNFDENTKQILGMHFERNNYASQVDIDKIQKKTGLEKGQIRSWYKRKREQAKKSPKSNGKENVEDGTEYGKMVKRHKQGDIS